jgi:integrase
VEGGALVKAVPFGDRKEITDAGRASYNRAYDVFALLYRKKFRDLRTADFQAVLDPYMKQSHSTLSKHKQLITQMSSWAVREELITTNFTKFVKLPGNIKKEKEIFSDSDVEKLEADGSEAAKIILMLIYTGMRIGELFSLPLEDYHETYVVGGEKTEAGRNRVIPIRPEGRRHFQYFAQQAEGPLLLSGYTGQRVPNNFRKRDYYPLLDKLEITRKTPHATRHTYASRARRAGMPPEILQKILGHADYSTTANIYVHMDVEELIKSVENC